MVILSAGGAVDPLYGPDDLPKDGFYIHAISFLLGCLMGAKYVYHTIQDFRCQMATLIGTNEGYKLFWGVP